MKLCELIDPTLSNKISALSTSLKSKYPIKDLFLSINSVGNLRIVSIIIDKEHRNMNVGSDIIKEINQFADKNNLKITLTPGLKDKHHGTTSRSRLIKFYKKFGFIENKGRNKDFTISDLMYRKPNQT